MSLLYKKALNMKHDVPKTKIILSDADGVLLNWYNSFEIWMAEKGHIRVPDSTDKFILSDVFGLDERKSLELLDEFNHSEYTTKLAAYKDSKKYVQKLVAAGFRFIVVTSLGDTEIAKQNRTKNLVTEFGEIFDEIVFLPTGAGKHHILERWAGSGLFWIEDHFTNAESGYELGLRSILVDTHYNRHYETDLFPRVNMHHPWHDIAQMIAKEYNISIDLW